MFRLRSSTYFLRGHNMLCLPKPLTTSYGINSFSYLAAKSWNSLLISFPDLLWTKPKARSGIVRKFVFLDWLLHLTPVQSPL